MNKIDLLKIRRTKVLDSGTEIRKNISDLIDSGSFVELSSYSFSKNEFYGEDAEGEGVVTGFATIESYPFYIVAQNMSVLSGGVSKANADKILKCMVSAEKNGTPIIYILNSMGIQIGEGITVLEGMAGVFKKAAELKGVLPQFSIINGECYGQISILSAISDFNFMLDNSVLAANSPLVISAKSGKNLPKNEVGGVKALNKANLTTFSVKNYSEIKNNIIKIIDVIPDYNTLIVDGEDLNKAFPALNTKADSSDIIKAVFDEGSFIEIGTTYSTEVKCILGRIGGISCGTVVFESGEAVTLNTENSYKIKEFINFAANYNLPFVNFVNCSGIEVNLQVNNSLVLKTVAEIIDAYNMLDNAKISVVYGKAIGLGYTLFASKSMGYDYTYAFANSKIALFNSKIGAEIEFNDEKADKAKLAEKYSDENSDPINAAKGGYIDNIIEPSFVKQYLIASLQMLVR